MCICHFYLPLCSAEQRHSYRFGTTWGRVNDRIFIFGWTIPLSSVVIRFQWQFECCCNIIEKPFQFFFLIVFLNLLPRFKKRNKGKMLIVCCFIFRLCHHSHGDQCRDGGDVTSGARGFGKSDLNIYILGPGDWTHDLCIASAVMVYQLSYSCNCWFESLSSLRWCTIKVASVSCCAEWSSAAWDSLSSFCCSSSSKVTKTSQKVRRLSEFPFKLKIDFF